MSIPTKIILTIGALSVLPVMGWMANGAVANARAVGIPLFGIVIVIWLM